MPLANQIRSAVLFIFKLCLVENRISSFALHCSDDDARRTFTVDRSFVLEYFTSPNHRLPARVSPLVAITKQSVRSLSWSHFPIRSARTLI